MKKLIFISLFIILNIFLFSEESLDDLLLDDESKYQDLMVDNRADDKLKATADKIVGQAFVQYESGDSWLQMVDNMTIEEKATILTLDDSSVSINLLGDISIDIFPKSKVFLEDLKGSYTQNRLDEAGIELLWGKIYSNVRRKLETGSNYKIKTGSVVAGVRGTKFTVSYLKNENQSSVTVFDGIVAVLNLKTKKESLLHKNDTISVEIDTGLEKRSKHKTLPPKDLVKFVRPLLNNDFISLVDKMVIPEYLPPLIMTERNRDLLENIKIIQDGSVTKKTNLKIIVE